MTGTMSKANQKLQAGVQARNGGQGPQWGYKAVMRSERKDGDWVPRIDIEGLMEPADTAVHEPSALRPVEQTVDITSTGGAEARMELWRNLPGPVYRHSFRQ